MIVASSTFLTVTLWTVFTLLLQPQRRLTNAAPAAAASSSAFIITSPSTFQGTTRTLVQSHYYHGRRRGEGVVADLPSASGQRNPFQSNPKTRLYQSRDWIDEVNYMDDYDGDDENTLPVAPDMKYLPRNVLRQNQNFVAIRQAGGKELTNDLYVREPPRGSSSSSSSSDDKDDNDNDSDDNESTFWYVGKIARVTDVTPQQAIQRQWNFIETHASQLRPIELFPARGSLEIWMAPGDSEMEVAYNRPDLRLEKVPRVVDEQDNKVLLKLKSTLMGFQGEVYEGGEEGFRTWRFSNGSPSRKEIQSPNQDELRTPTNEEMAKIQQQLEGQDLNALYEEQQRREGKPIED